MVGKEYGLPCLLEGATEGLRDNLCAPPSREVNFVVKV
jgi:hypothetical protein